MAFRQVALALLWVTASKASSDCDVDSAAYLQSHLKASSDAGLNLAVNRTAICDEGDTVNTGICQSTPSQKKQCSDCTGNKLIPSNAARFPTFSLLCENTNPVASPPSGKDDKKDDRLLLATGVRDDDDNDKVCQQDEDDEFLTFKDSNDYLTCKGRNSCHDNWLVKNVGAACCSVANAAGESCSHTAKIFLNDGSDEKNPKGTCFNDMCCDGYKTCENGDFEGIRRMSCRGWDACKKSDFEIEENLFCSATSLVSQKSGTSTDTCRESTFDFTATGDHCVACLQKEACKKSDFDFNTQGGGGGIIYQHCEGNEACEEFSVDVPHDSSLYLVCRGHDACRKADKIYLRKSGSTAAKMYVICDGDDACKDMEVDKAAGAMCKCIEMNGGECPDDCEDSVTITPPAKCKGNPDTSCCAGDEAGDGHPQCKNCGCTGSTTSTSTMGGGGDPHIDTLDKQHYLLLKQGTFSLWRFSGLDAEALSAKKLLKKLPVDFQLYAHYSGHASYTKGLILVDGSGGATKRVLELTSEDCTWRTKTKNLWSEVEKPELLALPDAEGDKLTAFSMKQSSHKQKMHVELLVKKVDGSFKKVANVYVRCMPGRHINTKISMSSPEDMKLVQGQVGSFGHTDAGEDRKASFLQGMRMRSDDEFVTSKKWTELGGSEAAATYLNLMDDQGPAVLKTCSASEKDQAQAICRKHFGDTPVDKDRADSYRNRLDNCVFDVCNGGGEDAALLAAEIFQAD